MVDQPIAEKVAHVRRERATGDAGNHHCHWPGCEKRVPPAMWGCTPHWYALPPRLRSLIWRTYRPGQEASKTPTRAYVEVARMVQDWIAENHPEEKGGRRLLVPEALGFTSETRPAEADDAPAAAPAQGSLL